MTDEEKAIKAVCEECESYWYCYDKKQLGDCVYNREYVEGLIDGRKEACQKILEEAEKCGFVYFGTPTINKLKEIIKDLGVGT